MLWVILTFSRSVFVFCVPSWCSLSRHWRCSGESSLFRPCQRYLATLA